MQEVRAHSISDLQAMTLAIEERNREQQRTQNHAKSKRMR